MSATLTSLARSQAVSSPALQNTGAITLPKAKTANFTVGGTKIASADGNYVGRAGWDGPVETVDNFIGTPAMVPDNMQELTMLYYGGPNKGNQEKYNVRFNGKDTELHGHHLMKAPMQSMFRDLERSGKGKGLSIDPNVGFRDGATMRTPVGRDLADQALPDGAKAPSLYANGLQFQVHGKSPEDFKDLVAAAKKYSLSVRDYSKEHGYMLVTPVPEHVYSSKAVKQGNLDPTALRHMHDMAQ